MTVVAWLADWLTVFDWTNVLWCLALILAILAGTVLLCGKRQELPAPIEIISLAELSQGWIKQNAKAIPSSELSLQSRDDRMHDHDEDSVVLNHPQAEAFLKQIREWAFFKKFPQQQAVCEQLLQLLDREGDCPSVVNVRNDVEGTWDENTYNILGQTTLLDHSLNVAGQVVRLLSESQAWHVIPDTMVAALGHDLGKLESMRSYLYSTGEHPLAAGKSLVGIPGFTELPRKEEILRAIKLHHKMPEGLLGKTLKKADQLARQKELEETVQRNTIESKGENSPAFAPPHEFLTNITPVPETTTKPATIDPTKAAWQAQVDIYDEQPESAHKHRATEPPELIDISGWFDASQFLNEMKPYINKMFGRRFFAFSMPDGLIYFQVKVLEELARKQAERAGCMEIATMDQKDLTMRQVLFTVVHRLRVDHNVVARGLIKDTYFGGYFLVSRKFGKDMKGYYTPFHAEAFGSIAEMEQAKPDMLRDIDKVSPYTDNGDQEL